MKLTRVLSILILVLFLTAAIFGDHGLIQLYRLRKIESALEASNLKINDKNLQYIDQIQNLQDPKYLERIIRKELNLIHEDEVLFILD
jgi:cell division protein FtsB